MRMVVLPVDCVFFIFVSLSLSHYCDVETCDVEDEFAEHSSVQQLLVADSGSQLLSERSRELAVQRWVKTVNYPNLVGSSHRDIAAKINKFTSNHESVDRVVPCSDLDVNGVRLLAAELQPYIDKHILEEFDQADGRHFHFNPLHPAEVELNPRAYRDALCAETVKLWSHHIQKSAKTSIMKAVIPSLPTFNTSDLQDWETAVFNKSMSCVSGHNVVDLDETSLDERIEDWPHWPSKFHFVAKGHGPYPFWQFGERYKDSTWNFTEAFDTPYLYEPAGDMQVWHSTPQMASKFYHSRCRFEFMGFEELGNRPCAQLMLGVYGANTGFWYLYTVNETTKEADGDFCCEGNTADVHMRLGTINRKFMDNMKYIGESDFHGDFYEGRSKRYILAMHWTQFEVNRDSPALPINVWYETDLEGRPLRFGEVGQENAVDGYLHDYDYPLIYEEFDPTSYDGVPDKDDFNIPQMCSTTQNTCHLARKNRQNGNTFTM